MSEKPVKTYPTLGCCGLDCGLCPRYYTVGASRCPGCCGTDFFNKHPSCGLITCCVKKHGLEVCAQCDEFPCPKFKDSGEYQALDTASYASSYPPYSRVIPNMDFIREYGLEAFMEQQLRRIRLLERMIAGYDDGRSRSFYCRAGALLPLESLETALGEAGQKVKALSAVTDDVKTRAKTLRNVLNGLAAGEGIELKPRRKENK